MEKAEAHFVECGITAIVKHYTVFASLVDNVGDEAIITPEGAIPVNKGDNLTITLSNYESYEVEWYVTVQLDEEEPEQIYQPDYTLENIQSNHTVLFTIEESLPA